MKRSLMYNIEFYEDSNGYSQLLEFRPGNNRVFYFYFKNETFVLLHQFRKKSQKTPQRELKQALAERDDWKARHEKR